MPRFFLSYPGSEELEYDFYAIKPTIDKLGSPLSIRYEHEPGVDYLVDLKTGMFYVNGTWLCPTTDEGILLTNRKVEYRPVWFKRHFKTFNLVGGELDSKCAVFIGWQFTENGKNYKRTMQIHEDETIGVG